MGQVTLADDKAQAVRPNTVQTVAIGAASAAITNPVSARTELVRVMATSDCYIDVGTTPVATSSKSYLPAFYVEYFRVEPGTDKIAALQVTGAGTLFVTECN